MDVKAIAVLSSLLFCASALPSNQTPSNNRTDYDTTQYKNSTGGYRHCALDFSYCLVDNSACCPGLVCKANQGFNSGLGICKASCLPSGSTNCNPESITSCCRGLKCDADASSSSGKRCCVPEFGTCISGKRECCLGLKCNVGENGRRLCEKSN